MIEASPEETSGPEGSDGGIDAVALPGGMSPYATGGGGVTFERKVAVQYLAHLLVGDGASELGDGRCVVSVAFQQAPGHPVDDIVVSAANPDELQPSLVLALGGSTFTGDRGERRVDAEAFPTIRQCCDQRANGRTGTPVGPRRRGTTNTRRTTCEAGQPRRGSNGRAPASLISSARRASSMLVFEAGSISLRNSWSVRCTTLG